MSRKRSKSTQLPILDIVMLTAGRYDMLAKCLDALERDAKEINFKVCLLDNGSPAEERIQNEVLFHNEGRFVDFETKRLQQNSGYPRGANECARMGRAPLMLFLNDDVVMEPGTLDKMIRTMDDPTIGITGIKLLFPKDSTSPIRPADHVQHVGMGFNIIGDPVHPLVGWSKDNPKCCISRDVLAVTGSCMMTRRNLFNKVNGFDVGYGAGTFEDTTFCLQVIQMGLRIRINAEAVAYHYTGATAEKLNIAYPMQINSLKFKADWISTGVMKWTDWEFM